VLTSAPDSLIIDPYFGVLAGALGFLIIVRPLLNALFDRVQPSQIYSQFSGQQRRILALFVSRRGIPKSFIWLDLPTYLAYAVSGASFFILGGRGQIEGGQGVALPLLLLGAYFVVLLGVGWISRQEGPREALAAMLLHVHSSIGKTTGMGGGDNIPRAVRDWSRDVHFQQAVRVVLGLFTKVEWVFRLFGGLLALILLIVIKEAVGPSLQKLPSDILPLEIFAALGIITSLVLISLHIVLRMAFDNTRSHVEQLRFALASGELTPTEVPLAYLTIETLREAQIFTAEPIGDLLREIHPQARLEGYF
jgi:hypothetical protein